jgi:hypothetical protein
VCACGYEYRDISSSPSVGSVSACLQDDTTAHTSLALETDEMSPDAGTSVDLGVELFPNNGRSSPSNDVEVKSLSSLSQSTAKESTITYRSLNTESDEDSYMPRRRRSPKCKADDSAWEFLDDVSIEDDTLETEDVTNSVTMFGAENSSICWSVCSDDEDNGSTCSDSSAASAATLLTFTTETLEALFKPLADRATLHSVAESTIGKKAVKADDAAVPTHLWDERVQSGLNDAGFSDESETAWLSEFFRKRELFIFRRALYLDCLEYLEDTYGEGWQSLDQKKGRYRLTKVGRDRDAICKILWHANETSFFEYHAGSRLHFFCWPEKYRKMARNGVPVMFERPGPTKPQRQPQFDDPDVKAQVRSKVLKVINRRYMVRARTKFDIKSLIKYFAVPKGLLDVRIVYDATASGLNDAVWAPSFWLPTIDSLVRSLDSSSWMADRDIRDMFLNFQLHESTWCYAGVDIQPIMMSEEISAKKARWYQKG